MNDANDNEGIDAMDEMEHRLALMSIGESGYYVLVGALSTGAEKVDAFNVLVAYFLAGTLAGNGPTEEEEEVDPNGPD